MKIYIDSNVSVYVSDAEFETLKKIQQAKQLTIEELAYARKLAAKSILKRTKKLGTIHYELRPNINF